MSDGHHPRPQFETLEALKAEIDHLLKLQRQALDRAIYVGMTPEEASAMEIRRKQIAALVDDLLTFKRKE